MEKLSKILYSKKANMFMMYFSIMACILFIVLAIETIIKGQPLWYSIWFLLFTLLSMNSFRVSRKYYMQEK